MLSVGFALLMCFESKLDLHSKQHMQNKGNRSFEMVYKLGEYHLLSNSHSLVQSTGVVGQDNHPFVLLGHDA